MMVLNHRFFTLSSGERLAKVAGFGYGDGLNGFVGLVSGGLVSGEW
jgi:hypothetical protein